MDSIKQEYADPIEPAPEPYQRKRLKRFKEKNGTISTQLVIEPFDISEDVKWELAGLVTERLMQNSAISQKVEDEIKRNLRIQRLTKGGPQTEYDYDPKQLDHYDVKDHKAEINKTPHPNHKMDINNSVLDMTGFTKVPSLLDEKVIQEAAQKALRKNVSKYKDLMSSGQDRGKAEGRGRNNDKSPRQSDPQK